jgi:hypothetical protein
MQAFLCSATLSARQILPEGAIYPIAARLQMIVKGQNCRHHSRKVIATILTVHRKLNAIIYFNSQTGYLSMRIPQ